MEYSIQLRKPFVIFIGFTVYGLGKYGLFVIGSFREIHCFFETPMPILMRFSEHEP